MPEPHLDTGKPPRCWSPSPSQRSGRPLSLLSVSVAAPPSDRTVLEDSRPRSKRLARVLFLLLGRCSSPAAQRTFSSHSEGWRCRDTVYSPLSVKQTSLSWPHFFSYSYYLVLYFWRFFSFLIILINFSENELRGFEVNYCNQHSILVARKSLHGCK